MSLVVSTLSGLVLSNDCKWKSNGIIFTGQFLSQMNINQDQ